MTMKIGYLVLCALVPYVFVIGSCVNEVCNESLSKCCIRLYTTLICVNSSAIVIFFIRLLDIKKSNKSVYLYKSVAVSIVVCVLEVILILMINLKEASNKTRVIQRETFDLKEECWTTKENIKICYTQKKNEDSFRGAIVFMQPDYYNADLNGRVWYHKKNKKEYLGHTGKYEEISDFFVRAGYQTIRYDHSDNCERLSIETVLMRLRNILDERNTKTAIIFCAGNINEFAKEIAEILKPSAMICVGISNQNILDNILKIKEHIPVFIGDFGDDPYCSVKNENAIHFENTDFTFCVRGKRKLKKYGRSADNEGITDVAALDVIKEWLTEQD